MSTKHTVLLFFIAVLGSTQSAGFEIKNDKTKIYQNSLLKNKIELHGDKFKVSPKIKPLNPLLGYKKPSLNGNFSHQQQYQAAQKQLKLAKKISPDNQ